jgi:transposase-like protein
MEKKTRRQHSPEEKVRILRLHLLDGKAVSEICERNGIHPTLFYQWCKLVLVQRKKPDEVWRLSYGGGELLAFTFADFSCGFQL